MPVIVALWRLRWEVHLKIEASLGDTISSKTASTGETLPQKIKTEKQKQKQNPQNPKSRGYMEYVKRV